MEEALSNVASSEKRHSVRRTHASSTKGTEALTNSQTGLKLHDIQMVSIDKIKLDPSNPNVLSKEAMNGLRESFKRWGYLNPVILDESFLVADGEHRVQIYREFGRTEIPAYVLKLSDTDRRLLRQVQNKLKGEHEPKADALELKLLYDAGELPNLSTLIATDSEDLLRLLQKHELVPFVQEDSIPEVKEARVKRGEIYRLGNHLLGCGDAKDESFIQKLISRILIVLLLIDPPYGISIMHPERNDLGRSAPLGFTSIPRSTTPYKIVPSRIYHSRIEGDDEDFDPAPFLKYGETQIIFGANHFASRLPSNSHWLVWDKKAGLASDDNTFSDVELMWTNLKRKNSRIYRHVWSGLIREGTRDLELTERIHPTQKPVGLLAHIIQDYTEAGATVLDLFAGSGSTLIACEDLGNRSCIATEIDEYYCDVIIARWEKLTGQKAERIDH